MADQLARQGSSCPLIRPEPALGISAKIAREVIRIWTNRKHEEYWQSICGQKQAKDFLKRLKGHFHKCGSEVTCNVVLAYCYW
jgi:hypothetical protein